MGKERWGLKGDRQQKACQGCLMGLMKNTIMHSKTPPVKSHLLTRVCKRPEASCERVIICLLHVDEQIAPRRAHAKSPLNPSLSCAGPTLCMTVLHMSSLGWSALRLGFSLRSLSSAAKAESTRCSPHTEWAGFRHGGVWRGTWEGGRGWNGPVFGTQLQPHWLLGLG